MSINKTQQFVYFQNKAKHYDTIKKMKSTVRDKLDPKYLKTLSFSQSHHQQNKRLPLMRRVQIKTENQNLINRLYKMYNSPRTEVSAQGNYSRYNHQDRKFRQHNPYQSELNRTIEIGNTELSERLKRTKPRIGSSMEWNKHFGKTLSLKKNMSKYMLQSNKSKASLHISLVDNYLPKYLQTFLNTSSVIDLNKTQHHSLPKSIQITHQGLLILPNIKSQQSHPSHSVRHTKDHKKLIFDKSQSSLHSKQQKSQSSLISSQNKTENPQNANPQKKNQKIPKRRLLEFKFAQLNATSHKTKPTLIQEEKQLKKSQVDSTLKNQHSDAPKLQKYQNSQKSSKEETNQKEDKQ